MPLSKIKTNSVADEVFEVGSNLIINGAMQVWQRATAATTVNGAGVYNTVDRFKFWEANDGDFTSERSTTVPSGEGFGYSLKLAVTTADTSLGASQYAAFAQIIEAQNLQHLSYGTSDAKSLTLSFWVRSSKTGTYTIALEKTDSTLYRYLKEYSINTADTWEKKTITIEPDSQIKASAGAIANDNGQGFRMLFNLAWGTTFNGGTDGAWSSDANDYATLNQVNWMDSTSNNFYITGVQLEVGEQATPFQHEDIGTTLAKCQRYYTQFNPTGSYTNYGQGTVISSTQCEVQINLPTEMRDEPAFSSSTPVGDFRIYEAGTRTVTSFADSGFSNKKCGTVMVNCSGGGMATGRSGKLQDDDDKPNNFIAWSAEL